MVARYTAAIKLRVSISKVNRVGSLCVNMHCYTRKLVVVHKLVVLLCNITFSL